MTTVEKNSDTARAVPETELASVVLHAGEMSDVTYLKDYIQVIKIIYTFLLLIVHVRIMISDIVTTYLTVNGPVLLIVESAESTESSESATIRHANYY